MILVLTSLLATSPLFRLTLILPGSTFNSFSSHHTLPALALSYHSFPSCTLAAPRALNLPASDLVFLFASSTFSHWTFAHLYQFSFGIQHYTQRHCTQTYIYIHQYDFSNVPIPQPSPNGNPSTNILESPQLRHHSSPPNKQRPIHHHNPSLPRPKASLLASHMPSNVRVPPLS